jgi:hypothetical protein
MIELPAMNRFTDHSLGISIEAPPEWSGMKDGPLNLDLFAPEEEDYSAHVSLDLKHVDPPDSQGDWFVRLVEQTYFKGGLGLEQYQLVEGFELELDGHPGFLARYEWISEEIGSHFSQVDTLVLMSPTSLLEIHGFSLKKLEEKYIPIFLYIIHSIRFVSLQPEGKAEEG